MSRSSLLSILVCGLCLLNACGGGGSSNNPPPPLAITSAIPPNGTVQAAYGSRGNGFSLTASGGLVPYAWSWAAATGSAVPPGLNLSNGVISGTPSTAGSYSLTVTVSDSESPAAQKMANYTIVIANPSPVQITAGSPPQGQVAVAFGEGHHLRDNRGRSVVVTFFPLSATGGTGSYSWTWAAAQGSSLPPRLGCCDHFFQTGFRTEGVFVRGAIFGDPTAPGTYQVVVTVADSGSPPATTSADYTITIAPPPPPVINTTPAPAIGTLNSPYVGYTFTATEGFPPFIWKIETGALPAGIVLSNDGSLSGKSTAAGSFPISVIVQDSLGRQSAPQDFTIQVLPKGFVPTGSMETGREFQTATLLNTGKVLVAGGGGSPDGASAELFDPASGTFSPTGGMETVRNAHTATLLSSGKVLIAGGYFGPTFATAELYDPTNGKFAPTAGNMTIGRAFHTATSLNTGKVLVTGGLDATGVPTATAELFDPSSGTFTATTGNMSTTRSSHTATLLNDGTVLVTGGVDVTGSALTTAELFDPSSGTFKATTGAMTVPRFDHTATLVRGGKVLLAGGGSLGGDMSTAELFDSSSGTITPTIGNMNLVRSLHTATLLSDGTVLVTGGLDFHLNVLSAAEVFDATTGTFTRTADMTVGRASHTATLLGDGTVLVTGGRDPRGNALATAELHQ
jgi:PKD repeat protein